MLMSLLAIFIPVPLISWLLGALSRWRGNGAPELSYPYGANHNGTVLLPPVRRACASVEDVVEILKADASAPLRAVGSAKSNTRCLEALEVARRPRADFAAQRKRTRGGGGGELQAQHGEAQHHRGGDGGGEAAKGVGLLVSVLRGPLLSPTLCR